MNAKENLSESTSISIYETTEENPNNTKISQECLHVFRTNTRNILATESFYTAKPETVLKIFEQPELYIQSEIDLLLALEMYATIHNALPGHNLGGNHDNFCMLVRPALCLIRFYTLSPHELLKCTAAKKLLSPEEFLEILANLIVPQNSLYPYPKDFSSNIVNRAMISSDSRDSSGIGMICNQSDVREATVMWDITDIARRVNQTPNQTLTEVIEEHPLGNSTLDSVKLVSEEKQEDNKKERGIKNQRTTVVTQAVPENDDDELWA